MGNLALSAAKPPGQASVNAYGNANLASVYGLPAPVAPLYPFGVVLTVAPYGLTVLSYLYAFVAALLSLFILVSLTCSRCCGTMSGWSSRIDSFLGASTLDEKKLQSYNTPRAVLELVAQLFIAIARIIFRFIMLLLLFALPMFILFVLIQVFLQMEMYPDAAFSSATSVQLAARRMWNLGGGFVNLGLDLNDAVLAVFYNTYVSGLIPAVRTVYELVIDPIIHADGDFTNNPLYDEVAGFTKSGINERTAATFGIGVVDTTIDTFNGRRVLAPASLGITGGQQLFQLIAGVARTLAFFLDLYFVFWNTLLRIFLTILYPFMPYLGDIISLLGKYAACIVQSPTCAALEAFNLLVQGIMFFINTILIGGLNLVLSFLGDSEVISPIVVGSVACSAEDLGPGVSCDCRLGGPGEGGLPGIYSNLQGCENDQWACAELPDGTFQEVRTSQGESVVTSTGSDRATTCTHVRRALSSTGHHANMAEHGYYGCYHVCVNRTLVEACPPPVFTDEPHSLVALDDHRPCGGPAPLEDEHEHRRRLDVHVTGLNDVLHRAFAVQHESVRVSTKHAQRAAAAKHKSEREATTSAKTKQQFEQQVFAQYKEGEVLSRPGGFACQLSAAKDGDTMISRYFEAVCMMQTASTRAAQQPHGMSYISSAVRAYTKMPPTQGRQRRRIQEVHERRALDLSQAVIAWSENVMIKSAKVRALRHSTEQMTRAEKFLRFVDILDEPSTPHMAQVHRRLGTEMPHRVAVDRAIDLARASSERLRALIDLEFPDPQQAEETHRRQLARGPVLGLGIFESEPRCLSKQFECPDGTCVAARKDCKRIPGQKAGVVEEVNWFMLDLIVSLDVMSDVGTLMAKWDACWKLYEQDDSVNPYSLANVATPDSRKKNVVWCFPYYDGISWRAELSTFNFKTWTQEQCNTIAADGVTVTNGCTCELYYDKHLQVNINERWIPGVPIFEYARLHNGLLSAQYIMSGYITRDTWLDRTWQWMLSPAYFPLWWSRLWGDQGHPGTPNQQFLCAWIHLGSVWYTMFTVLLFFIGAIATVPVVIEWLRRWFRILEYLIQRGASKNKHVILGDVEKLL